MTDEIKAIRQNFHAAYQMYTMGYHSAPIVFDALMATPALLSEIDRLNAELLQKTQQLEAYTNTDLTPDEFKQSVDYVLELNKKCAEATGCTAEEIASLRVALAASQRRERAAVEDLSGHCEYCAFRNDCAKHDNNDTAAGLTWWTDCEDWEWRGPQEGGE